MTTTRAKKRRARQKRVVRSERRSRHATTVSRPNARGVRFGGNRATAERVDPAVGRPARARSNRDPRERTRGRPRDDAPVPAAERSRIIETHSTLNPAECDARRARRRYAETRGARTVRHRRTRWSPTCSCGGKARGPWTASCRRKRSSRTPDRSRWCEARVIAAVDIGAARFRASGTLLTERRRNRSGPARGPVKPIGDHR